jgi:ParB family chromosome partitioning protein
MGTKSSRGLGRGLGSLLPEDLQTAQLLNGGERIQNIPTKHIVPSADQPRTQFDEKLLQELATSIGKFGIIQPLVVSLIEQNKYSIIAGERRWRAAQLVGLAQVPVIVRTFAAQEKLEVALIENVQRVDLSPLEQAISIERLHQQFNMTYVDIAARLGKAPTTINNIVRLLQLPEDARQALGRQEITEGHARAILALKGIPEKQAQLLKKIMANGWSVRQAEQFAIAAKEPIEQGGAAKSRLAITTPATRRLAKRLKTKVKIRRLAKGGLLEIGFLDDEHLEHLLDTMSETRK